MLLTGRDGWDDERDPARPGNRRAHAGQPAGRGPLPRRAPARAGRPGSRARRDGRAAASLHPPRRATRTRWSGPACAPTSSAAAATGPSSRSPTSARCWRRSPTHSTTRRCWARSPRPPAGSRLTRSGCCAPRRAAVAISGRRSSRRRAWARTRASTRERLEQIPAAELSLLRSFAATLVELRRRATSLSPRRPDRRRGDRDRL